MSIPFFTSKVLVMQSDISNADVTTITIQLNELRSRFDQAIREGHEFQELKETYLQMKELECYMNALQWDPENATIRNNTYPSGWARQ